MNKQAEKIIIGVALSAAAYALLPAMKATFRSLAGEWQAAGGIACRVRSIVATAREEVEDIIAEARFEQMKKRLDREIALNRELSAEVEERGQEHGAGRA